MRAVTSAQSTLASGDAEAIRHLQVDVAASASIAAIAAHSERGGGGEVAATA